MRIRTIVAGLLPALAAMSAAAQTPCPCGAGTRVAGADLVALLGNRTVCAAAGGEEWQEYHRGTNAAGGQLIDYKKGPTDPVDPTETVGRWSVQGEEVVYNYLGSGAYAHAVCQSGNTLSFCGQRTVTGATLRNGQVACAGSQAAQLRSSVVQRPQVR